MPYDKLVVAVGAYSQTFGIPGVREHAHFLRDVSDARRIRLRVLSLFEAAAAPSVADDAERRRLLRFAVVGGGPTGIEFAAELHDLVHEDLARIYPSLAPLVDITVYDIAPAVLPMFDRRLAEYATGLFRRRGIRVRTETHLDAIRPAPDAGAMGHLKLRIREDRDEEDAGLVVWSTGLMQNPLVEKLVIKEIRRGQNSGGGAAAEAVRLVKDAKTGGIVTDAHLRARVSALSLPDAGNDAHQTSPRRRRHSSRRLRHRRLLRRREQPRAPQDGPGRLSAGRLSREADEPRPRAPRRAGTALPLQELGHHGLPGRLEGHPPELRRRAARMGRLGALADRLSHLQHVG